MSLSQKIFWIFSAIVIIQIFLPVNSPENNLNSTYIFFIRLDHVVHTIVFIVWMILYKLAYFSKSGASGSKILLYLGSGILLAVFAEVLQSIIPYRAFSLKDMVANLLGVIICTPLLLLPQNRYKYIL
jgi:VanZ family protein